MKKLLLALLIMASCSIGFAGPIDTTGYSSLVSPDDVTINWLNNFRSGVVNFLNSFPGDNIQSGTIVAGGMSDNANPEIRWGEASNEFVYTGLLPPSGAGLSATTTAGTAYIKNDTTARMTRVVKDATVHTYTASKDTYVDLSTTGTYTYTEVVNGAATPAVAANSIRLAKVVTDGTDVTSVTDLRVTGVQIATNEDFDIKGFELWYSNSLAVSCDDGVIYNGSTRINKTSATVLTLATATDWWDGVVDSYAGGAGWCYIGINSSGSIKLLGANPPAYHDTSGTTAGKKYYWYDTANYWRVIGAVRVGTSNTIVNKFYQDGSNIYMDAPADDANLKVITGGASTSWADVDCTGAIPGISTSVGLTLTGAATAGTVYWRPKGSSATNGIILWTTESNTQQTTIPYVPLSSAQVGQYKLSASSVSIYIYKYRINIRD